MLDTPKGRDRENDYVLKHLTVCVVTYGDGVIDSDQSSLNRRIQMQKDEKSKKTVNKKVRMIAPVAIYP